MRALIAAKALVTPYVHLRVVYRRIFNENLARHVSASYDFGSTYSSRKHAGGCWTRTTITMPRFPCDI